MPDDTVENELQVALRRLLSVTRSSFEQRAHLERALEARIVIEQAKGILAERLRLDLDEAYALIRRSARSSRRRAHEIAAEVVGQRETPAAVLGALQELLRDRA